MTQAKETRLNWSPVLKTAPLGLLFAYLTITATVEGLTATKWLASGILVLIGIVAGNAVPGRPFRHGLLAGFAAALVAIETQALFLTAYFANNPQYADIEMPFGWSPRLATAVLGPLNAILAGLLAGFAAWLIARIRRAVSRRPEVGD